MCSLFDLYRDRGWEFFKAEKFEEAIAEWRVAYELDPEDGYVLNNIGRALSKLGREEDAIAEWRKAIRLEPDYAPPHTNLASALSAKGYSPEALAAVRAAIRLKPDDARLYDHLGFHLMAQAEGTNNKAEWEKAIGPFQQSIALDPTDFYARHHLAQIQWFLGRKQEAIATLQASIAAIPDSIEAHLQLTEYQAQARQFRDMMQTINTTNKLPDPEEKIAHYYSDLQSRILAKFRPALFVGAGLATVLIGFSVWNRRRG